MSEHGPAICVQCKHVQITKPTSAHLSWYHFHCRAAPLIVEWDPVRGVEHRILPYCREINKNGNCQLFEQQTETLPEPKVKNWLMSLLE